MPANGVGFRLVGPSMMVLNSIKAVPPNCAEFYGAVRAVSPIITRGGKLRTTILAGFSLANT
ncbi:hypothetical protein BJX99DRAFT_265963 [Aspergillus californicus]